MSDELALLRKIDELEDRVRELEAEVERLRALLHNVQEIYAGMDGFQPVTAPEGYLLRICKQMYDAALGDKP